MKKYLLVLFLFSCTTAQVVPNEKPVENPVKPIEYTQPETPIDTIGLPANVNIAGCPAVGLYQGVDLCIPVDQKFLDTMKKLKVTTIIRYGDIPGHETIRGKIAFQAEKDLIARNGFKLEVVFQHSNRWANDAGKLYNTFNGGYAAIRGPFDAEWMQQLYPELSRWFAGVDFDAVTAEQIKGATTYMTAFCNIARKYGKKCGVYGSGKMLELLRKAGIVDYVWISQSTGFSGTKDLTNSGRWDMLQKMPVKTCGGKEFDPNVIKLGTVL